MSRKGRPRKPGERTPIGALKRRNKDELTHAHFKRFKAAGRKVGDDGRFGSELGRLGLLDTLTSAEVRAGFRVAGIYARFDRSCNVRRTARSPAYTSALCSRSSELHDDGEAAKSEFDRLQDEISGFDRRDRAALERLCVDDGAVPEALPGVKAILSQLARRWGIIPKRREPSPFVSETFNVWELAPHGRALVLACYLRAAEMQQVEFDLDDWADDDWQTINNLRVRYVRGVAAERFSPDFEAQRASLAESIQETLLTMLQTVERRDSVSDYFWQLMGLGRPEFERGPVHAWLKKLLDRTRFFDALDKTMAVKVGMDAAHSDALSKLVFRLADHFRFKGLKPTASDMYVRKDPDPSPFVALVGIVMHTLPEPLRPDAQSTESFSKVISKILNDYKRKKIVGTCETIPPS
jgi:hypothetical protein